MNTLQKEWEKYRKLCYEGAPPMQLNELHQTFFVAAFATLTLIIEASINSGDEEAAATIRALLEEVTSACEEHMRDPFDEVDQRN